jgi:Carboxypeptidase regulatory-like domain
VGGNRESRCNVWISVVAVILMVALPAYRAFAQLPTGTILGVVRDSSGAALPGATVTIHNADTDRIQIVTTGEDGSYRVPALPVGRYEVRVEHAGFKTVTQQGLVLEVTQEMVVSPALQIGTATETVVVTSEVPLVNTTNSSLGGLVDEKKIADLPLNGRNYIDLTLLQPGINHSAEAGTISSRTTGIWFSSNGAPPRSNHIMLDGAVLNNVEGAIAGSVGGNTIGIDGIREYQVITNMFGAEYGVTMGSQVVMVSKSGTNKLHGDVFEYLRNDVLDAANYFDSPASSGGKRLPPYKRNNFGGSIGGALVKDKTFFHLSYEGLRENLGLTPRDTVLGANCYDANKVLLATGNPCAVTANNPNGNVNSSILPLAQLFPYPNIVDSSGNLDQFSYKASAVSQEDFGQVRLDQNFSVADSAFFRYTSDKFHSTTNGNYPLYNILLDGWNHSATLSETHIFNPALVNTARLSFSRVPFSIDKVASNPAGVDLTDATHSFANGLPTGGIIIFGNGFSSELGPTGGNNRTEIQNTLTASDDVFYTKGRHALKFGLLFNRYGMAFTAGNQATNSSAGEVAFGNNNQFLRGVYISYDSVVLPPSTDLYFKFNSLGFYAQDDFRATSRLTLNLGLRYEFNTTPHEINGRNYRILDIFTFDPAVGASRGPVMQNDSLKNFSPRIGFAYDPFGTGKTSIRGGFGFYYDVGNIGSALSQYNYSIPPLSNFFVVNNFTGNPNIPFTLPVPFTFPVPSSLHTLDYHSKQPYLSQYNLTVERQLPGDLALSASYVGSRGVHLFTVREQNPFIPTSVTNGVPFWNPDPAANPNGCPNANATGNCRYNPNVVTATMVTTNGDSWYNALQVNVNKRFSHGVQAQLAYTWSKSLDTTEAQAYVLDCFQATGSAQGIQPFGGSVDKGPSCFDLPQNLRLNLLYRFPNIKSDNFAAKFLHGWWVGSIVSMQSGYPFTPYVSGLLSNSGIYADDQGDRPNYVTSANLATAQAAADTACVAGGLSAGCVKMQVYNPKTVITGKLNHWFNENMFTLVGPNQTLAPGQTDPCANTIPNCSFGHYGDVSRDGLRGPHFRNWDFSINKDTKFPLLGEAGAVEFRAEIFNILNHPNFGLPNNYIYGGGVTDELPTVPANAAAGFGGSGGVITSTGQLKSRQVQFALKVIF